MRNCCAGHENIVFGSARCPLCEKIRLDDRHIFVLENQIEELELRIRKLTNEKVSNLKENWNGGAS